MNNQKKPNAEELNELEAENLDQVSGGWGKRVPLVPHKPKTSGGTEPEEDDEEE